MTKNQECQKLGSVGLVAWPFASHEAGWGLRSSDVHVSGRLEESVTLIVRRLAKQRKCTCKSNAAVKKVDAIVRVFDLRPSPLDFGCGIL